MMKLGKLASLAAITASMAVSLSTQSFALSVINPIDPQSQTSQETGGPVSAFNKDAVGSNSSGGILLSADEVQHIRWCAERYAASYNASDNTYISKSGQSEVCRSR